MATPVLDLEGSIQAYLDSMSMMVKRYLFPLLYLARVQQTSSTNNNKQQTALPPNRPPTDHQWRTPERVEWQIYPDA